MHYKNMFPSVHLESADVPPNGSLLLRITHVEQTTVEGDKGGKSFKALIGFEGPEWLPKTTWIAPVTVCRCIAAMFGDDTDGWMGKRVTVSAQTIDAFGDKVPAVRPVGSPDIAKGLRVTVPKGRGKAYITLERTPEPGAAEKAASDARKALAVKLAEGVKNGAEVAFVRAACEESGVCSPEFVDRLVGRLFPVPVDVREDNGAVVVART